VKEPDLTRLDALNLLVKLEYTKYNCKYEMAIGQQSTQLIIIIHLLYPNTFIESTKYTIINSKCLYNLTKYP